MTKAYKRDVEACNFPRRVRERALASRLGGGKEGIVMADQRNVDLPDGTDTIIEPAEPENSGAIATGRVAADEGGATVTIDDPGLPSGGLADRIRTGREQLSNQAGEKARGLVTQG